ncbi:MAG: basic amino acid ABC transporter substrate-binding protein [Fusobacteriota bacterium]
MKKILIAILVVITTFGFVGCGESNNEIVMGTNAEFPPFEYREGGKITGFDIDLAKKISEDLGKELKIVDMRFDGLIPALQSDKVDFVIAGMTATKERAENVNFSDAYYEASQVIIVRDNNNNIKNSEDLKGKKIGVQLGTTGDVEAQKIDNVELKKYNAAFAAIMELKNEKLDAIILDSEPAKNFVKQNKGLKVLPQELTKEEYAIAINKDNNKLTNDINKSLNKLKDNGEYDILIKKYFQE